MFDKVVGGVVTSAIALADARGIQKATGNGQLNELGRGWSKSSTEHMGFVMTKDTKKANMLPANWEELKESYDIFDGGENSIPADLIVNWDQRGMRLVPVWSTTGP